MGETNEVYLVNYKRTAFSRSRPNDPGRDVFNSIRMDEGLAKLIDNSTNETGIKKEDIEDVIVGCALQADENWTYGGKHPALLSALPVTVPSMAIDRACASSLNALSIGAMEIMTGNAGVVLAGGMEHIRDDASLDQRKKLSPAFRSDGVITAGNSSPLNAGASLTMLMSGKKVEEYGLKPLARIVSIGWAAVPPSIMGEGPVPASRKALGRAGLKVDDIDLWEINEAFAVVVLNAIRELNIDPSRVNVNGGAIAIGHPLGATGARLAGTVTRTLQEK